MGMRVGMRSKDGTSVSMGPVEFLVGFTLGLPFLMIYLAFRMTVYTVRQVGKGVQEVQRMRAGRR